HLWNSRILTNSLSILIYMISGEKLLNKVTIITGGAQGIGKTTVEMFASQGAKVVMWDINEDKGRSSVMEFREKGFEIEFTYVDTTRYPSVEDAAKKVFDK